MHIGLLTPELTHAHGWGRYSIDLAGALAARGVALTLAVSEASPGDGGIPNVGCAPLLPRLFPAGRWTTPRSLRAVPELRRLFADCDIIHATAEHYLPAAALVAQGRPVFVTAHGTYLPVSIRRRSVGWLFRRAARRARILPVSHYTAGRIRDVLPGAQLHVIHNGVRVERFRQPPESLPEKRGPTVLGVGVNKARKGFHILLEAVAQVRDSIPDVQCVIAGDASDAGYAAQLQAIIEARSLGDSAHILGRVPEDTLRGWYHAADVFALPALNVGGKFEGFGLVYLEAGAAGLPVIGTTDCGAEEAVTHGETGLLVPQDDPAALAAAITQLLGDPDLRARLGAAGQARAFNQTWDHAAAQVQALYAASLLVG